MRLRTYLVGLAVIASSFIAVNPVEAQSKNGWYKAGCTNEGRCYYVKKIGGSWPFIKYKLNGPDGMFTQEADCQQWRHRSLSFEGVKTPAKFAGWRDVMPDAMGESWQKVVCR